MGISIADLDKLRNSGMQYTRPVMNRWENDVVATATITTTPQNYPIGEIAVTWVSGRTNVEKGHLWIARTGTNIVSYGVVRLTPTTSRIYIDGKSRGDSGIARNQIIALQAGQTITVYSIKPLWSLLSRINNGTFFKKFDIPYDGSGSNPAPVVNIGSWRQAFSDPDLSDRAEFTFDSSDSYFWLSKTRASTLWTLPAGATITSGSTSSTSVTFTLPEGFHIVKCTITDSGGASMTATRPVWVNGVTYPALSDEYGVMLDSDSQDRKGRNKTISILGQVDYNTFLPGQPFHYAEDSYFDGQRVSDGVLKDNFAGFTTSESQNYALLDGEQSTTFEVMGPWAMMEMIPMVSQAIVEVDIPADWTDVAPTLGTPDFIAWYILYHHTTYLELFDYYPLWDTDSGGNITTVRKLNWGLNGSTVSEYLNQCASVVGGNVGCASDGALYIRKDPNLEDSTYRDALNVVMDITVDLTNNIFDVTENVEVSERLLNETGQIRLFALSYNGSDTTAFASIAPGYFLMQATSGGDEDSYIVKPVSALPEGDPDFEYGGQEKVNRLAGHVLAKMNKPVTELQLTMNRNMDVFEPCLMEWVNLDIPASMSSRNVALNTRALPISVDRAWEEADNGAFVKVISLSVEPESFGQPGETFELDTGGGGIYPPIQPPILDSDPEDIFDLAGFLVAVNEDGRIARTKNGAQWTDIAGNIATSEYGGVIKFEDVAIDFYSEYVNTGFVSGGLGAWAIVTLESVAGSGIFERVRVYYTNDILASNVKWIQQYDRDTNAEIHNSVRIVSNQRREDNVAFAVHTENGNYYGATVDGGTNWTYQAVGDIVASTPANIGEPIDIAFAGGTANLGIVTSAWDSGSNTYKLWRQNTPFVTGAFITGSPESNKPFPMVTSDDLGTTVYATRVLSGTSTGVGSVSITVDNSGNVVLSKSGILTDRIIGYKIYATDRDIPDTELPVSPVVNYYAPANNYQPEDFDGRQLNGWIVVDEDAYEIAGDDDPTVKNSVVVEFEFSDATEVTVGGGDMKINYGGYGPNISSVRLCFPFDTRLINTAYALASDNGFARKFVSYDSTGTAIRQEFGSLASSPKTYEVSDTLYFGYGVPLSDSLSCSDIATSSNSGSADNANTLLYRLTFGVPIRYGTSPFMLEEAGLEVSEITYEEPDMYRITGSLTGTPLIESIDYTTEGETYVAVKPYAISVDSFDNNYLSAVLTKVTGIDDGSGGVATSANKGSSWVYVENPFYYGISQSQNYGMAWGFDKMFITDTGFTTAQSVIGNWLTAVGDLGEIKTMKALFI